MSGASETECLIERLAKEPVTAPEYSAISSCAFNKRSGGIDDAQCGCKSHRAPADLLQRRIRVRFD